MSRVSSTQQAQSSSGGRHMSHAPKMVGRYELHRTLGTGAYSLVRLCRDVDDNSLWAMKIIDKALLRSAMMEEQMQREVAVMKILQGQQTSSGAKGESRTASGTCPHIVKLREVLESTNHFYLILEYVTGGELFDKIVEAGRFDEETARRYFKQLVTAVAYCHSFGVAHRDLKPENLLIDAKGILRVSDFGLSNKHEKRGSKRSSSSKNDYKMHVNTLETVCGTSNYVAPEVIRARGYNGFAADVWSCGVILFVMIAGYMPFDDPDMGRLARKIDAADYKTPSFMSSAVAHLISRMLTPDPTRRITLEEVETHPWMKAR